MALAPKPDSRGPRRHFGDTRLLGGGVSRQRPGTSGRRSLWYTDTSIKIVITGPTLAKRTPARSAAV